MELDEIPDDQDDDDDEKDELASDAEGVVVSTSLLLRPWPSWVPGGADMRIAADGMSAGLTGRQKSRPMAAKASRNQGQEHCEEAKKVQAGYGAQRKTKRDGEAKGAL